MIRDMYRRQDSEKEKKAMQEELERMKETVARLEKIVRGK